MCVFFRLSVPVALARAPRAFCARLPSRVPAADPVDGMCANSEDKTPKPQKLQRGAASGAGGARAGLFSS